MHFEAAHLDRRSEIEDVSVGVGYGNIPRKQLQSSLFYARQFPYRAIAHISHATECLKNRSLHTSDKSPYPRRLVQIFQHHNAWRWNLQNALPPVRAIVINSACDWSFAGAQLCRRSAANHGRKVFEYAELSRVGKTRIAQPDIEGFDRIRNRAGGQKSQSVKLRRGYRLESHANPFHKLLIIFCPIGITRFANTGIN